MIAEHVFALLLLVFIAGILIGEHARASFERKQRRRRRVSRIIHDSRKPW